MKYVKETIRNGTFVDSVNSIFLESKSKCVTHSLVQFGQRGLFFLITQQIRLMYVGMMMIQKPTESNYEEEKKKPRNKWIEMQMIQPFGNTCELLMHIINKVTE